MNGETNSADGSNENEMIASTISSNGGNSHGRAPKKAKLRWKNELQQKFLEAIDHLGLRKAMPKTIQEFMNVKGVTRTHIASHLQKYRRHLKKVKLNAKRAEIAKRINRELTSSGSSSILTPQGSYKCTQLSMENLFQSQLGHSVGQSSLILKKSASRNYMVQQTRSNLLPVGGCRGYSSGVLPLNNEMRSFSATHQVSLVPGLGQYVTPNGSLGMQSNYTGINVDANGNLLGADGAGRVDGNAYGSPGAMNLDVNYNNMSDHGRSTPILPSTFGKSLSNGGQTQSNLFAQMGAWASRSTLGTSQAPRIGQHGTRNDVYNAGINTNEYIDLTGRGGARFNGTPGEIVGTMNNNMTNQGSSTSRLQRISNAQLDGLIPILESLSVCNNDTGNTVNSQFDQNQVE
ncbi:PREDICTED: uncharacterized protein LOC109127452 [Camelina sativa]|uniref:Uncharacterized protein LOC109127452 n=1 Tax=Camelina sativa TaxID=90675 RepID=A0ABM1QLP5_CAMSA|nr:PREDICTED: uncharacterized protein LOC109127452 [Camelina sativa]